MKAISVRQPYADLIAFGFKTVEVRTWTTDYRGPLMICASRGPLSVEGMLRSDFPWPHRQFVKGCALAVVLLKDCVRMDPSLEAAAYHSPTKPSWAWLLEGAYRIPHPFEVRGRLGLFEVEYSG